MLCLKQEPQPNMGYRARRLAFSPWGGYGQAETGERVACGRQEGRLPKIVDGGTGVVGA